MDDIFRPNKECESGAEARARLSCGRKVFYDKFEPRYRKLPIGQNWRFGSEVSSKAQMANDANGNLGSYQEGNELLQAFTILLSFDSVYFVLTAAINSWLLASILTSETLRHKVRNQLICSLAILHLLDAFFINIIEITLSIGELKIWSWMCNCSLNQYLEVMNLICSAIADILIATLASVFLAQVLDFDPIWKLEPRRQKTGKFILLVFPWVFAGIAAPLTIKAIRAEGYYCHQADWSRYFIMKTAYTVVPLCLAIMITAAAVTLRRIRFVRDSITAQGIMYVQLSGSGPEIDNSLTYITAVIVSALCEITLLVVYFEAGSGKYRGLIFIYTSMTVSASRSALLPLTFLFLRDIRERIKTWRPWRRGAAPIGIDLTVAYHTEN
ncbi:hypothetical protein RRG08_011358 [Elysia crispata]|uniref:G-protein coupled receptors family 1 profile domain-containing protein n=1 Tax=Elysia crispata TaxID=231223 RepID=A0AAE1BCW7_9GAST|nr:hypothetical protein RRG08_011358 [Elysia crispata]